jgi:hypothetical protein
VRSQSISISPSRSPPEGRSITYEEPHIVHLFYYVHTLAAADTLEPFMAASHSPPSFFSLQRDCPNGQLTRKKFLEVYSSFFPMGNAEKFCEHVFRTFDSDNSGKIDFKEFLLAINITSAGKPEQKLEWAFSMYDVNGDGTIEPKEMEEIISVRLFPVPCLPFQVALSE